MTVGGRLEICNHRTLRWMGCTICGLIERLGSARHVTCEVLFSLGVRLFPCIVQNVSASPFGKTNYTDINILSLSLHHLLGYIKQFLFNDQENVGSANSSRGRNSLSRMGKIKSSASRPDRRLRTESTIWLPAHVCR